MNPLPATGARKAALAFIFITVLIDVLAFGVIIPVLPHLVQQFVGGDTSTAAYWTGAPFCFMVIFNIRLTVAQGQRYSAADRRPSGLAVSARHDDFAGAHQLNDFIFAQQIHHGIEFFRASGGFQHERILVEVHGFRVEMVGFAGSNP